MLYDGIAAESAHVSIAGRSTASIIDGKKHFLEQRARPPLARFSNLARLERGRHARYGSFAAEHFAPLRSGVWWWVITHHQSFNFQTDLDMAD